MKIQALGDPYLSTGKTSPAPKPPTEAPPADPIDQGPSDHPELQDVTAWKPLPQEPRVFGEGLTSSVLMATLGPLAVAISKSGRAVEEFGKRMGWWDSIGGVTQPLPPSLLNDLPPATMQRPLLLVPGWHTPKDRFNHLVEKLTEDGRNGGRAYYVANGEFFSDIDCTQKAEPCGPEARVFIAVFPKHNTPPDQSAPDLTRTLDAIESFTQQSRIDVTGYSQGGQAARICLDQGKRMGKVLLLGTPNQGSAMARTALGLLDLQKWGYDTEWVLARKPLTQEDRCALGWLLPVSGGSTNPQLSDLNSRFARQKANAEAVAFLGSNSRFTLGRYFLPDRGDGTVTARSLRLEQEPVHFLKDSRHRNHGLLFSNPETYLTMRDYFGWT